MSPQEAHRRVGHEIPAFDPEPQPCPTRRSLMVARAVLAIVILGAVVGMCAAARAADVIPVRVWVLYDETANRPWVSPKGNEARTSTATACALATVEAARYSPAGTRLACRKTTNK